MLEITHLHKKYGERTLFADYNLCINDGEFVVILGESGTGKTTLLNMIGGLEPVTSGNILINKVEVTGKKNKKDLYGRVLGFLFQGFGLLEEGTVFQNLEIVPRRFRSEISFEEAMKRTGISELKNHKVFRLSGGEQQRVALCRLMVKKCELILADEPTGNLDPKNAENVMKILRSIGEEGKTVIVVTHDTRLIRQGDRVIRLVKSSL